MEFSPRISNFSHHKIRIPKQTKLILLYEQQKLLNREVNSITLKNPEKK